MDPYESFRNEKIDDFPTFGLFYLALHEGKTISDATKVWLDIKLTATCEKYRGMTDKAAFLDEINRRPPMLITEPIWNSSRLEQAVGRAVRHNSHVDLPNEKIEVTIHKE